MISADVYLIQALPANFSTSSFDGRPEIFDQYIENFATASDGLHSFNGRLRAAFPNNLNIQTDGMGNVSFIDLLVQGEYPDPNHFLVMRTETIEIRGFGGAVTIDNTLGQYQEFHATGGTWQVTPEPGSWALAGTAFIACAGIERRRRRRRVL
jgi:hypothetical protein